MRIITEREMRVPQDSTEVVCDVIIADVCGKTVKKEEERDIILINYYYY